MQKVGCCPPGSLPALTVNYNPQGEVRDLENGLKIYHHGSGDNVVIIINDIFGFNGGRTKAIVDHLAHEGFNAILPDLFRGQSFDPNTPISVETVVPFIQQFQWEQVWKDIKQVIDTVRSKGGNKKFALLGFCWGAWVNFNACGTGEFVCAANPHPALLLCPAYQQDVFELIKNIKCPQLLLPAGNDEQNLKEGGEIIKALESKPFKSRTKTYPEMLHGWVSRGDLTNPAILRDCTDALQEVVSFLRENFTSSQKVGCCPPGSLPALTVNYNPQGEVRDLENGLKIYHHGSGDNVVIIINDIFGFNGGRTKAIVDHLAHEGFNAILPDLFRGQSFDPNTPISVETVVPFIQQFQWEQVWKDIKQVIDTVRSKGGNKKFALLGFCWGAWVNFNACGTGEFVCAANPHPALLLCPAYQQDVFELIKNIKCPQLLLPAGNDEQNLKEGGEIIKALESKPFKSRTKTYPEMLHGWVSRGDLTNPAILRDCTDALQEVVSFLRENFS